MSLLGKFNELQHAHRFAPSPKLSQNFLVDESVLEKIADAAQLSKKDTVLEIGAGTGFLTNAIALRCKKVVAVEFDQHLHDVLDAELPKNVELLKADILSAKLPPFDKIVSTPPYDISSPLLHKLFHWKFDYAVLVFQLEFVEKLLASPGFPNYHAISVLCQYYFDVQPLFQVKAGSFFPVPKSDSGCVLLKKEKSHGKAKNDGNFELFVEQLFRFKNKNIEKALRLAAPFLEKECKFKPAEKALDKLELSGKKTYTLEVSELVELFNALA